MADPLIPAPPPTPVGQGDRRPSREQAGTAPQRANAREAAPSLIELSATLSGIRRGEILTGKVIPAEGQQEPPVLLLQTPRGTFRLASAFLDNGGRIEAGTPIRFLALKVGDRLLAQFLQIGSIAPDPPPKMELKLIALAGATADKPPGGQGQESPLYSGRLVGPPLPLPGGNRILKTGQDIRLSISPSGGTAEPGSIEATVRRGSRNNELVLRIGRSTIAVHRPPANLRPGDTVLVSFPAQPSRPDAAAGQENRTTNPGAPPGSPSLSPAGLPGKSAEAQRWPLLEEIQAVLLRHAPELARGLQSRLPQPGPKLTSTMLFLLQALGGDAQAWLGAATVQKLRDLGREDLLRRLSHEKQPPPAPEERSNSGNTDMRSLFLPFLADGRIERILLHYRQGQEKRRKDGGGEDPRETRFMLDLEFSRLGRWRLDGLVRARRFDLIIRSQRTAPEHMRRHIETIFHDALSLYGYGGEIAFSTDANLPPLPPPGGAPHPDIYA